MTDDRYDRITWHDGGKTVDKLTAAALTECERRLGYSLTVVQGSYNAGGVSASAGTHDGGGVVDLAPWDWANKVRVLRTVGFAAWHRPAISGLWGEHIHAVLIGNEKLSLAARQQVTDYINHKDGLATHYTDNTWHPSPIPTFKYPAPKPDPKPETPKRTLNVGTFNLLRGRSKADVAKEVISLLDRHKLDVLAVQEAEGYLDVLGRIKDFDYYVDPSNPENGILVVEDRGADFLATAEGDGWTREGGATRGPGVFPRVTVDGWLRVGSQHWPPGTNWRDGKLVTAKERIDDVTEWAEASTRFLQRPDKARLLLSDYNERASTTGLYSPGWVAQQSKATIGTTGRIDYGIGVRCTFRAVHVAKDVREASDHEPITMQVVES